jgi:hypothetical protein
LGAQLVHEILKEQAAKPLRGAIVWIPMLATDLIIRAEERKAEFYDVHATYLWDHKHVVGRLLAKSLHLKSSIAWDMYLLYSPGRSWQRNRPPQPIFWMHQLDEDPSLFLDSRRLKQNVQALIDTL